LAALTPIKLFVEMLKISKNKNKFKEQSFVEESRESIEIILFFAEMKSSNLINYLTHMC
jgi:hypothetical protein